MIGTSLPEYVFIRACIFLLQYTTPLCLAGLGVLAAASYSRGGGPAAALSSPLGRALAAYAATDALFFLCVWRPRNRRLRRAALHPAPLSRAERGALLRRCLDNVPDVGRYLRGWFLGADARQIRRDNVRDFVLWGFFDRWPGDESAEDEAELEGYLAEFERRLGRPLEPGRGDAEGLRLTLDRVETRYRSVVWYLIIGLVDLFTHCLMEWHGFRHHAQPRPNNGLALIPPRMQSLFAGKRPVSPGLGYWYRPHTATDRLPVVFLHGIGIGLSTYVPYLARLNPPSHGQRGQVGIIAVELLPISFRLTGAPLDKAEFLRQITAIVEAHGWQRFVLAAHSYGTVLATHMLSSPTLNPRIESAVLMDPVSILLHLPDVAYNFTRRRPRGANEWQLWYFASMDPGVAHCLGRHFFWKENIVWKEDLVRVGAPPSAADGDSGGVDGGSLPTRGKGRRVAVCLSERDLIVDTATVAQYLAGNGQWWDPNHGGRQPGAPAPEDRLDGGHMTAEGIEVFWFRGLDHAQAFDSKDSLERLSSITRRYCAG
ncbi:hypothetical protein GGR56DRAFT_534264 [Xylariaceae sp. FL0804]|nr:hypothetical protein GGR56DRAFT_534264 [Xylariaceae sp. FL0804]